MPDVTEETETPAATPAKREYKINGKWVSGVFQLVGPAQDFLDVAELIRDAAGNPDGNGICWLSFDSLPVKQAGA